MSFITSGYSLTTRGGAITARGGWDANKVYFQDDVVIWNSVEWQCLLPRNVGNQPDTTPFAWVATSTIFAGSQFNNTAGGTPKFIIPQGIELIHTDGAANLIGGLNALADPSPTPGTLQRTVPDLMWLQNGLRLLVRDITSAEVDDPCDFTVRRCGPVSGYPYAGGRGTGTCTKGSPDIPVTNTDTIAISNFLTMSWPRLVMCVGAVPLGANILSVTSVDANNVIVHLDTPATATGAFTLYAIGINTDVTGVAAGSIIGEFQYGPFAVPHNGDITTRGAIAPQVTVVQYARTKEMPRDLTGAQDFAMGTGWRLSTTRVGRQRGDDSLGGDADGSLQIGLGAVQNQDGSLCQIRGTSGQNEKQDVTIIATSGTCQLTTWPDPTTLNNTFPSGSSTAPMPFNAPLDNNDGGAGQNDLRFFLADAIRLSLAGGPNPPTTAQAYAELKFTVVGGGGPAGPNINSQPFTIEFGGQAGSTHLNLRNFTRLNPINNLNAGSTFTVKKNQEGIPTDQARTWLNVQDATSGATVFSVAQGGVTAPSIVPAGQYFPAGGNFVVPATGIYEITCVGGGAGGSGGGSSQVTTPHAQAGGAGGGAGASSTQLVSLVAGQTIVFAIGGGAAGGGGGAAGAGAAGNAGSGGSNGNNTAATLLGTTICQGDGGSGGRASAADSTVAVTGGLPGNGGSPSATTAAGQNFGPGSGGASASKGGSTGAAMGGGGAGGNAATVAPLGGDGGGAGATNGGGTVGGGSAHVGAAGGNGGTAPANSGAGGGGGGGGGAGGAGGTGGTGGSGWAAISRKF